jgi:predicted nucleic acid-binding protein
VSVVVDASLLIAAVVDAGPVGSWAERIVTGDPSLAAPSLVLAEATNILRRLEASERLTRLEATSAQQDLLRLDIQLFPFDPIAERVWQLRRNLTCYDAWYVAVAESLGAPLATLDERLSKAPGPTCPFLLPA